MDEIVEIAARALYNRDHLEAGHVNFVPWWLLPQDVKDVYRRAVTP